MIFLELFWAFFKIGLFTIGGGYAMIPMIQQEVIAHQWLTSEALLNFIAVAESTPGSFAINVATFVGVTQAGILGGVIATFAVVLPSLVIVMIIAKMFARFKNNRLVQYGLWGVRPVVSGLILSAALTIFALLVFPTLDVRHPTAEGLQSFDGLSLAVLAFVFALSQMKIKNRKPHPILLIVISAATGILLYGVCGL